MNIIIFYRLQCDQFEISQPDFSQINELKDDLSSFEGIASIFEEYSKQLTALTNEDWVSFRFVLCYLSFFKLYHFSYINLNTLSKNVWWCWPPRSRILQINLGSKLQFLTKWKEGNKFSIDYKNILDLTNFGS